MARRATIRSKLERWYPFVFGVVSVVCYFTFFKNHSFPKSFNDVFSTSTTLSGIAIGFLITAKSILFSIDEKYIIQQLKSTQTYRKLINYFMSAIRASFILAFVSLLCLFVDFTNPQLLHKILFASWLFSLFVAGSSCYRVIDAFADILKS